METDPPFITLTGADENTDIAELAKLDAEVGILYSPTPRALGTNRYPRWEWIREASLVLPRVALHVCGIAARSELLSGNLQLGGFNRIQLNGTFPIQTIQAACKQFPGYEIITQHNPSHPDLSRVPAHNHALLLDESGGRGVSPVDDWSYARDLILSVGFDKPVGFAGGLGPDNLEEKLKSIIPLAGPTWWVDMEAKLRDEEDWFSIERATEAVTIFHATMFTL